MKTKNLRTGESSRIFYNKHLEENNFVRLRTKKKKKNRDLKDNLVVIKELSGRLKKL
jgi:hypothetical protein